MKKRTSSKTLLKPTKYQHVHFSGRSRGPPQTTKITPGAPLDPPPDTLRKLDVFSGPPGTSPRTPQGPFWDPPQQPALQIARQPVGHENAESPPPPATASFVATTVSCPGVVPLT